MILIIGGTIMINVYSIIRFNARTLPAYATHSKKEVNKTAHFNKKFSLFVLPP
jgi:hypothetical protein